MEKKQTAVQWLANEILKLEGIQDVAIPDNLFQIASQLEREQIEEAYMQGDEDGFHSTESQYDYEAEGRSKHLAEQYYTQTFNQ
jgi:hypothetical protein